MESTFVTYFNLLINPILTHPAACILAIVLIIAYLRQKELIQVLNFFLDSRTKSLDRRTDELSRLNDRYFSLYEQSVRSMDKIAVAIDAFRDAVVSTEGRIVAKIDTEMASLQNQIRDSKEEIRNSKIDQLANVFKERESLNPGPNLKQ